MALSPRDRRLRSDHEAMVRLQEESSILRFTTQGAPPDRYLVTFQGRGISREPGRQDVAIRDEHTVLISLTAAYPRMIPELVWKTPIFHPNISAGGVVCLGGYQTNWVPSLKLDELCQMLWDMVRFANYDVESPYNREAALWAKQVAVRFPLDDRPLRDQVGERARTPSEPQGANAPVSKDVLDAGRTPSDAEARESATTGGGDANTGTAQPMVREPEPVELAADDEDSVVFIDAEVIEESTSDKDDILFIE